MSPFSPNEQRVIKAIGRKKRKITEIALDLYDVKKMPNANLIVNNAIKRINAKLACDPTYGWTIASEGAGRLGKTVWRANK